MSHAYQSKPSRAPKLAIVSSHKTSAPVSFSQRAKFALPKLPTDVKSEKPSSIDLNLEIPSLSLPLSSSDAIVPVDSTDPLSQEYPSLESDVPATLLPLSIWDPFSDGDPIHSQSEVFVLPHNLLAETASFEIIPESSYSQFSSSSSDFDGATRNFPPLLLPFPTDSRRRLGNDSFSSSSKLPAQTLSNLNLDGSCGSEGDFEVPSDNFTSSHLIVSQTHRMPSKRSSSLSLLQPTLSTSVENFFPADRSSLDATQSGLEPQLRRELASKSTQNLFRHSQSMPLKRRFSSYDVKPGDELTAVWKPQLERSKLAMGSEPSDEIPEEEIELTQERENIPDHLPPQQAEFSVEIPETDIECDVPLLVQGIKIPVIRVLKPKLKFTSPPHLTETEDPSIHHFCLSTNNDLSRDSLFPPEEADLPSHLEGIRYHRRPKFLYPLWLPSSPKYSVNRAKLKDKLCPLYDPSSSQNNTLDQGYFQNNLFPFTKTKKENRLFDASLDRAVKHEFSSLNDLPSALEGETSNLRRVLSQSKLEFLDQDDFIFPQTESVMQDFDQIEEQKDFIHQFLIDKSASNSKNSEVLPRHHSVSYSNPLTSHLYPIIDRRHSIPLGTMKKHESLKDNSTITNTLPLIDSDKIKTCTNAIYKIEKKLLGNSSNSTRTALLECQRGILLRLTGCLTRAHESLTLAIELEPGYGEPYWHRSLTYYVNGMDKLALMDLQTLLILNPKHAQAYKLRGEIYSALDLCKIAMQDYSEAISLNPKDTHALLMRSELYQRSGDPALAMEDLRRIVTLDKSNVDVLFRTAHYQFGKEMYQSSLENVSTILQIQSDNVDALCLRGKCFLMLQAFQESLKDFSAAIHFDPSSFLAFFYRGCILRKCNAWQAVRDFSNAIVLDVNNENTQSLLHRAIVYRSLKLYEEAFFDFLTYVKLNPTLSIGHTLLGLMYLKHQKDYHRAVHHFTLSIGLEPTNAKTYACRGDTYFILSDLKLALLDYSRASHLSPENLNYHILRGRVLLNMDNLALAKKHLHYSKTPQSRVSSPAKPPARASLLLQHVVVENFLGNHEDALALLEQSRSAPTYTTWMLFGKTHMKLKNYQSALENFDIARRILQSGSDAESDSKKIANIFYLQGLCEYSLGRNLKAIDTLTESLLLNPHSHEAYYFRGLASIKSPYNNRGILDLNKSLAINAKFFQAYLARASYYFMERRISKAILNCNEAIDLESKSIRAYFYRGTLKYFIELYPSALQDLSHAIELDPCCYLAYYSRAACYNAIGSYYDAIKDYTIALILFHSYSGNLGSDFHNIIDAKIVQNRGLIYFHLEDYFNALCDFKHVSAQLASRRKLTKSLAFPLHQAISISLHRLGQVNQAVNSMNLALELDITSINGFIGRGNIYMDYMNLAGLQLAKNDYCRALHLDPTSSIARINIAFLLQFEGKYAQAWRHLTNALETDPYNPHALEARAIICLQMQDMLAATLDIDRALKVEKTPQLLNSAGIIYFYSKFPKQAMELFTAATKLDPSYQLAFFNAGTLLLINRLYIESEQTFSKGESPEMKLDEHILINRSVARLLLGRKDESLEDLRLAEEMNPNYSHIHVNKAYHHVLSKQTEIATECYQQALSIGSNNPDILHQMVETLQES